MINVISGEKTLIANKLLKEYGKDKIESVEYEDSSLIQIYKKLTQESLFEQNQVFIISGTKFLVNKSDKLKKKEEEVFKEILNYEGQKQVYFLIEKELNQKIPYVGNNKRYIKYSRYTKEDNMEDFVKKQGIKISKQNLAYAIDLVAEDVNLEQELLKLALNNNFEEISSQGINIFMLKKPEETIFKFIELLIANNLQSAYNFYKTFLKVEGFKNEQLIALLASQVRYYIQVKIAVNNYSLSKAVDILKTSSYRLRKTNEILKMINLQTLIELQSKIAKYDYLIKSGKTHEQEVLLNFFIE